MVEADGEMGAREVARVMAAFADLAWPVRRSTLAAARAAVDGETVNMNLEEVGICVFDCRRICLCLCMLCVYSPL